LTEVALPVAEQAEASTNPVEDAAAQVQTQTEQPETEAIEPVEEKPTEEPKPEKTHEQREIDRMRRKIDRLVRQREELRARTEQNLTRQNIDGDNQESASDSEQLTLSRAELARLVEQRAREVAPQVRRQLDAIEHRQSVVDRLSRDWGQERFDALASDLDDAFGGLRDQTGNAKPATDAIFEADDPKQLIEYLADPDNGAEALRISRMSPVQAGRAVALLEAKLAQQKAQAKPEPSKVPAPIEAPRGQGRVTKDPSEMTDKEFAEWRRAQIKARGF
jgi:hypothetical protein